ncbi:MAG: hypothetical protein EXR98_07810 [Gemmataceae bacterium]|nr:hypothetical protein [Gemmataceae bacterium]
MRKWLYIGTMTFALGCVGCYFYFNRTATDPILPDNMLKTDDRDRIAKNDGNAELSETIEPLRVEGGGQTIALSPAPAWLGDPLPRIVLEPGMKQPPRPDGEPGRVLRMPYADEEEILALPLDPIQRMLDVTLPRLNLADDLNQAEESEPKQVIPLLHMHPHLQHGPFSGGCPAPYPYRVMPRE